MWTEFWSSLNQSNIQENIKLYSESEDNSDWITELALSQTNSVQNVTWIRLCLSMEFALALGTGHESFLVQLLNIMSTHSCQKFTQRAEIFIPNLFKSY